jgi:SagB-type dehydrogenase family enzyme
MDSEPDSWPSLGCPRPRSVALAYVPVAWNQAGILALPWQTNELALDVRSALAARRTRRSFGLLPRKLLAALLQAVQSVTGTGSSELGFPTSFRPTPSAGAIHPVHLVISSPDLPGWHRYDPFRHALLQLASKVDPATVRQHVDKAVPSQQGTLIMLVAEPAMTAAKYEDPASLVWRDAGVLLGYLSVAAQALDLNFCLLGATGEPWAGQLIDQPGLHGVGLALAGTPLP